MLLQAVKCLVALAAVLGILVGVFLLTVGVKTPHRIPGLKHWLLDADILGLLNRRRSIEKPIYRHHRLSGMVLICGASIWMMLLYHLAAPFQLTFFTEGWLGDPSNRLLFLTSWGLALFVLIIGVYVFIRPSALKSVESMANLWIEPFPASIPETTLGQAHIRRLLLRSPQLSGMLLVIAGIACLLALAI